MLAPRVIITTKVPDDWPSEARSRLDLVARRAVDRAVATVLGFADTGRARTGAALPPALTADVRERIDATRVLEGGTYRIPSRQRPGDTQDVPLHIEFDEQRLAGGAGNVLITGVGDEIRRRPLAEKTVFQAPGQTFLSTGGSPYVVAANLPRALEWGSYLFGSSGFAVWHERDASGFYVGPILQRKSLQELYLEPRLGAQTGAGAGLEIRPIRSGAPRGPRYYMPTDVIAVVTPEGVALVDTVGGWNLGEFQAARANVPREDAFVEPGEAQYAGWKLLGGAGDSQTFRSLIVNMDRTMFALLPWEERAKYLVRLISEGPDERERIAIIELIHGSRTQSELEAVFSLVRQSAYYEELFDKLDGHLFELLQHLGSFWRGPTLDWRYVWNLVNELNFVPDQGREFGRAISGLRGWFASTVEGLWFLFTRPGDVVAGLWQLGQLYWLLSQAYDGDEEARQQVDLMISKGALALDAAMRGMRYAEQLGLGAGRRGSSAHVSGDILGRLKYALIVEVLSWFIGVGEVKVALRAAKVPEALSAIIAVVRRLGRFGKAADVAEVAVRLEGALLALARLAGIAGDEAKIARLVAVLPHEHLSVLAKIAELVDFPRGVTVEKALAEAIARYPELERGVAELRKGLAVASRLEARFGTGALTQELAEGLRRLLRDSTFSERSLLRLVDEIPVGHLDDFMHTLTYVKPEHFAELGVGTFRALAQRPVSMHFLREVGSDVFVAAWRRAGGRWENMARLIDGIALQRATLKDPAEYQRFLDRLVRGEAAAVQDAEAVLAFFERLRQLNFRYLLEELRSIESRILRAQYAGEMARLGAEELEGLEHVARLYRKGGGGGGIHWVAEALELDPAHRSSFLRLVRDLASYDNAVPLHNLDRALRSFFEYGRWDIQGSMGQMHAALELIERYGAREIWFEHRWMERGLKRHSDIVAHIPARGMTHVEVKTNLTGAASFDEWEITRDLVLHADDGYRGMLYLYHPSVAGELPQLGDRMIGLFRRPSVRALLSAKGIDPVDAERALRAWVNAGGLATY